MRHSHNTRTQLSMVPLAVTLAACANGDGLSLTVRGDGFASGDVRVAVTQPERAAPVACEEAAIANGAFDVPVEADLAPGVPYRVDAFVDLDGDARCEFGVDAVMSIDLAPLDQSSDFTFTGGAGRVGDDPRGCAAFGGLSFRVELEGVTGSVVRYALVKLDDAGLTVDRVLRRGYADVDGARLEAVIDLQGAGKLGHFYRIDLFEADTTDAACGDARVRRISIGKQAELTPPTCTGIGEPSRFAHDLADPRGLENGDCSGFAP